MQKHLGLIMMPALLCACGNNPSQGKTLVASFYPIAYLVERIAGDAYDVQCLVPAGEEPHDFDLKPSGARALEDAKAVFLNGLGMEGWAGQFSAKIKAKTHVLSDGFTPLTIEGKTDPHLWLDPASYREMGRLCMDKLCEIDAQNAEKFHANYASFSQDIDVLMADCNALAANFDHKVIAVNHAAFGYMAERFHFTQLYINNVSPNDEPSQKALEAILNAVNEYHIDTIFFEELASDSVAKKIAEATGAKCESLNPLEGLSQEQLDDGQNYFSVYREDMNKIARAKP